MAHFSVDKYTGIAKTLEVRNEQAIKEKLSYMEFLELLIEDELANRKDNSYKKRFQKAHFPFTKTLEEYDFNFQPTLNRQEIYNLATCEFIRKKENVVFIGPPGTGNLFAFCIFPLSTFQVSGVMFNR